MQKTPMSKSKLEASLGMLDLTLPEYGHAIYLIMERIKQALSKRTDYPTIKVHRSSLVTTSANNFDKLRFSLDNPGRSSRYTRYLENGKMLRTHTSAMLPPLLEELGKNPTDDVILMCPGIIFRRDIVDMTHCGEPHQMDVWRVKRGAPSLQRADMKDLVETMVHSILPDAEIRYNEVSHPYTVKGLEVEIKHGSKWLEILECGQIHPDLLRSSGLDPEEYSGLASGMGLDRLVMLIKGIGDIRLLRAEDQRIASQMKNLDLYVSVSKFPSVTQDLSLSVWNEVNEEDICDWAVDAMGEDKNVVEEIKFLSETSYEQLPPKAIERLGIKPGQKNLLIRVVLRSHEKSLTHEEANIMRDRIYVALNQSGTSGYLG